MSNVVFMGTPDFAVPVLQTLIQTQTVVGVVTQPDRPAGRGQQLRPSPIKVVAEAAGIPLYQPKSLRKEEAAAPLRDWQPDIIVVAAFGQILRPHVLELPPHGCLNVHASLLPRWRGASPIQHAILEGDAETGITLMQMDVGLDTGAMFVKESVSLAPDETAETLHDKLAALGGKMIGDYLDEIVAGKIKGTPQDDALSTYAPMIRKEDGQIDWTETAVNIDRRFRAMSPWPGAFTHWQGKMLKLKAMRLLDEPLPAGKPGEVLAWQGGAAVQTSDGGILLERVQLAGKRATDMAAFLNGRPDFIGVTLHSPAKE